MKKLCSLLLIVVLALTLCCCDNNKNETPDNIKNTKEPTEKATEATITNDEIELTVDNIEEYISFEVYTEASEFPSGNPDNVLNLTPVVEGDYSGVNIVVDVLLYDNYYIVRDQKRIADITHDLDLTKDGGFTCNTTIKKSTSGSDVNLRGPQGENDPSYVIKSVSGTLKY